MTSKIYDLNGTTIVIDGRNAERGYGGEKNPECLTKIMQELEGARIILVHAHWIKTDFIKRIKEMAKVQLVDVTKDPEWDDKIVLAICMLEDGYYVSNDTQMFKHLKGNLADKNWCDSRRIGFQFDEEGDVSFQYPDSLNVNIASLELN
jgi:hypothetical protein|tara:strand:- start:901 stop:1347 length:447 start_codon:yes stop_codon:yes gene_type:complete